MTSFEDALDRIVRRAQGKVKEPEPCSICGEQGKIIAWLPDPVCNNCIGNGKVPTVHFETATEFDDALKPDQDPSL